MKEQIYLVALGGNLPSAVGAPALTLRNALVTFEEFGMHVEAVSRFYETPCFPAGAGPDYVNAAVRLRASLDPAEVLTRLHKIEAEFGRERVQRWGMRTLDLDLIAAGEVVLPDENTHKHWRTLPLESQKTEAPETLVLPHPRLSERAFVLVPLADVAQSWRHPILGQTVQEMLAGLSEADKDSVKAL